MPKKAASNQEKQVTEAAFLTAFNKKKAAAQAAAKTEKPAGGLDDKALLAKLGIEPGDSKTYQGNVSKITFSFAKNDANRPMFRFVYIIVSDDKVANGVILSDNHIIEEGVTKSTGEVWRTEEEALEKLYFAFQDLGEETSKWKDPIADAVTAAKRHTKDKTPVSITIKHWDNGTKSGMNLYIGTVADAESSDLDDSTEETTETTETEGGFNADDWIGGWAEFKSDEYGDVRFKIDAYDADAHTFSGTDTNGEYWEGEYAPSADVVEWSDNQED